MFCPYPGKRVSKFNFIYMCLLIHLHTDVPLTDSDEEEAGGDTGGEETDEGGDAGDAQGQSSGAEDNASGDADGDPDTWEQGSQASTVIENPSDCEEFAAEHGVPAASTEQGLINSQ